MNGYPPGTPNLPLQYSLPGRLHRLFSAFVFLGLPNACFVFARLFARWGERSWANYSVITGIAFVVMFIITSHFALPLLIQKPGGLVVEITDGTAEYDDTHYRLSLFYDLAKTSVIRMAWLVARSRAAAARSNCRGPDSRLDAFGDAAG